jgi:cyclin-dependent kinase regulatory subunit CKS1
MLKKIPGEYFDTSKGTLKLLWEEEWRGLGITQVRYFHACLFPVIHSLTISQSLGWEHYEVHEPEPHILLFKYEFRMNKHFSRIRC